MSLMKVDHAQEKRSYSIFPYNDKIWSRLLIYLHLNGIADRNELSLCSKCVNLGNLHQIRANYRYKIYK